MPILELATCSLVGCEDPTPAERHALDELGEWIGQVCGKRPPVSATTASGSIVLRNDPSMGAEEFSIKWENDLLVISGGRPRGVLYGVYEFLDRFLGVRWIAEDEALLPSKTQVDLPSGGFSFRPILAYREPFFTEAFDGDWAARNRVNSTRATLKDIHGGKVTYVGFVHTFNNLVPPEEYFSSHPEYFSEVDGRRISERTQLCLTNPEVVKIASERALQWLRQNPSADIISVSQNDWQNPCQCKNCSRVDEEEGSHSGSLLHFVNQVAERIEQEFPDVWVDTLAYQYTRKPPKNIRPRSNVIVRLCSIECCFSHTLGSCPENESFRRDTEGWARVAHTLYVWDYVTNFAHYLMPFPNLKVLQPNVQFFVENNVKGIFEEGNYSEGGGGEFAALRSYLLAKILWDPDCDVEAYMSEFLEGYYGPGSNAVAEYIENLHDDVGRRGVHVRIFDPPDHFLTRSLVQDGLSLLEDALSKTEKDSRFHRRLRIARLPLLYSKAYLMDKSDPGRRQQALNFIRECRALGITNVSEGRSLQTFEELVRRGEW